MGSWTDIGVILVSIACAGALGIHIWRGIRCDGVQAWLQSAAAVLREKLCSHAESFRLSTKMIGMMRGCSRLGFVMVCALNFSATSNILKESQRMHGELQDVSMMIASVVFMVTVLFPRVLNMRTIWLEYSCLMACCCLYTAGIARRPAVVSLCTAGLWRFVLSMCYPQVASVFFWNLACFAVGLLTYRDSCEMDVQLYARLEIMLQLGIIIATIFLKSALMEDSRKDSAMTFLQGQTSALLVLLNSVCDVVVELDANQRIIGDVPRLTAMLTLGGKSATGMALQHFMLSESDRERFTEHMCVGAHEAEAVAGGFDAKMRDGMGIPLSVDIFYVHFVDSDGQRHSFVGMKEVTDLPVPALRGFSSARNTQTSRSPGPSHRTASDAAQKSGVSRAPIREHVGEPLDQRSFVGSPPSISAGAGSPSVLGEKDMQAGSLHVLEDAAGASGDSSEPQKAAATSMNATVSESSSCLFAFSLSEDALIGQESLLPTPDPVQPKPRVTRLTSTFAQDVTVIDALSRWIVKPRQSRSSMCCPLHGNIRELKKCCLRLERLKCAKDFAAVGDLQCSKCGIIETEDGEHSSDVPLGEQRSRDCLTCGGMATLLLRAIPPRTGSLVSPPRSPRMSTHCTQAVFQPGTFGTHGLVQPESL